MRRLHKPSPAFVLALVALFVALGGTSYAALSIPANSVGSKQLKKNAVTTKKIKNHAVTAAKINTTGLTVPNATHAGSATSAGSVDGSQVTTLSKPLLSNTTTTIFSGDDLTLTAVCNSSAQIGLTAQSSDPNAELNWFGTLGTADTFAHTNDGTGTSPITVLALGDNEGSIDIEFGNTSGQSVTAQLGMDYDNAYSTTNGTHCGVFGTIIAG
jgi:hypothetical protein